MGKLNFLMYWISQLYPTHKIWCTWKICA